jgi:phage shock protein C
MAERLYRSRDEKMLAGVCGGLAEYFKIDPVLVRAIFVALLLTGPGAPLYLVLWIIVPLAPTPPQAPA